MFNRIIEEWDRVLNRMCAQLALRLHISIGGGGGLHARLFLTMQSDGLLIYV